MKQNDTASLLSVIDKDLIETGKQLSENAYSGHELLAGQAKDTEDVPLAKLLFLSASLGTYHSEELRTVAVGLELLRLASDKHYSPAEIPSDETRNFYLVSADYYYARAIYLAAGLNKGIVIEYMTKAIAELAEAKISEHKNDTSAYDIDDKSFSLFRAAVKLGVLLGECPSELMNPLDKFASSFGLIYQSSRRFTHADPATMDKLLADVRDRALSDLRSLPAPQYYLFEKLISF